MVLSALEKAEKDRQLQTSMVSRLEGKLNRLTAESQPMTEVEVDHYTEQLVQLRIQVIDTHRKILGVPQEMELEITYENSFMDTMDKLDELEVKMKTLKVEFPSAASIHSTTPVAPHSSGSSEVKLPRLELPLFNGKLIDWMNFHDMFVTAVKNNSKLSKAQKLTYLRSVLTGEAANLIKSIPSTDANFEIAWQMLLDRFQNDRELVFSILKRFMDQPTILGDSPTGLRSLLDVSQECVRSLKTLKIPVEHWDGILVFIMAQKLDGNSRQFWELSLKDKSVPVLTEFVEFLEQRARAIAAGGMCKPTLKPTNLPKSVPDYNSKRVTHTHHANAHAFPTCKICSAEHFHYQCQKLLGLSIADRRVALKKAGLCFNCLRDGHMSSKCPSQRTCRICKGKHNTIIHLDNAGPNESPECSSPIVKSHHSNDDTRILQTMLATAVVRIQDQHGKQLLCRALLDGGSTSSFVTEACAQRLGLARSRTSTDVQGLASANVGTAKGILSITVRPHNSDLNVFLVKCLILPKITGKLPTYRSDPTCWPHLQGLDFADPSFYTPAEIDVLFGGDVFWDILLDGKRTGPGISPIGIRTILGWLVAGNLGAESSQIRVHHADVNLDERLRTFWEVESIPSKKILTPEEELCEEHFQSTHTRQGDGRFVVSFPFRSPRCVIGTSRDMAIRRLKQLERRLERQPESRMEYNKFMEKYLTLGHMAGIPEIEVSNPLHPTFYIPHHFVLKESSTTTRFRVVFDASANASNGVSLNNTLLIGPTLQDNITEILMRFRNHTISFTADIAKMYRQIIMTSQDTDMQRIVWREDPSKPIQDFRLLTVTYGTASAPHHAVKALQQLARLEMDSLPLAAKIACQDFYVYDLMSGSSSEAEAKEIQSQLLELMRRGGFCLRKWYSNSSLLLECLPADLRGNKDPFSIDLDEVIKTLGLCWNPGLDEFMFRFSCPPLDANLKVTKRQILSELAKVFDPLGWLSPVTIRSKIMFQQLWKLNIGWDDVLPPLIKEDWIKFRTNLQSIEQVRIRRCTIPEGTTGLQLHGFCDASESAFAAVVYIRATQPSNSPAISLVAAKTRVAPTKTISIPRLELCGAVLVSELMTTIKGALKLEFEEIRAWTDSTVVIDWIREHPSRWKTFVANRTTMIQEHLPFDNWGHVSGIDNPADCASRGIDPSELVSHSLWWNGPSWLNNVIPRPPAVSSETLRNVDIEEKRVVFAAQTETSGFSTLLYKFSSLRKLKCVTAWCRRFVNNCQATLHPTIIGPTLIKKRGPLSAEEMDDAFMCWIRAIQCSEFKKEIYNLSKGMPLPNKSQLLSLNPFLDASATLRVGGRLRHAPIPEDQKTPILLPRHHRLTELVIQHIHLTNFHAGPQLLMSTLISRFWVIGAKDAIRHQVKKCVICTRHNPQSITQIMGNLPPARVTPARAFLKCGVDYAGPFILRAIPSRSKVTFKSYMALFICFTTHALHLEVVSCLSTDGFMAALKRFIARRGKPSDIYSDCGTNFIGAARELIELQVLVRSNDHNNRVTDYLSDDGIKWHINPPAAPHFGGLWEAGVKSVKYHLHRVLGKNRLTFEELTTTMAQIEACLNSRPLTPISTDPNDFSALTPGHFLIGSPLTSIPEPDITHLNTGRLSRWQMTQQLYQHFWNRWSKEFLSRLQQRPKWMKQRNEIKKDDLVLIKDEKLSPLQWRMGRVIQTHPGSDNIVRVVTLKTAEGIMKRPIIKLCLLPIDSACNISESGDNM